MALAGGTKTDDEWLACLEKGIKAKVGDQWKMARWNKFLKEVVWWLHHKDSQDDKDMTDATAALVQYGILNEQNLISIADNKKELRECLVAMGALPAICDSLFNKYIDVAQGHFTTGGSMIPEHYVPVLLSLVVSSIKSGWEKAWSAPN